MLSDLIALVRTIARYLVANSSPGQLAAGFTIGMIIGIVPKTNLIALSLCVVLFSLRCNKGLGLVAAIVFSFVGQSVDPFAHKIGLIVLSIHSMQAVYASLFNLPFGPWLGVNNTVVTGTLLLGLYVAYPVFWFTRLFFAGVRSVFVRKPGARLGFDAELQPGAAA